MPVIQALQSPEHHENFAGKVIAGTCLYIYLSLWPYTSTTGVVDPKSAFKRTLTSFAFPHIFQGEYMTRQNRRSQGNGRSIEKSWGRGNPKVAEYSTIGQVVRAQRLLRDLTVLEIIKRIFLCVFALKKRKRSKKVC